LWSRRYDKFIRDQLIELRHENKVALQGNVSGPAISSTYLASDIMGALAFYSTKKEHPKAATSLALAGSVSSLVGTGSSLALTNLMFLNEKWHRHKLKRKHLLPEELMQARLNALDELDKKLAAADPHAL